MFKVTAYASFELAYFTTVVPLKFIRHDKHIYFSSGHLLIMALFSVWFSIMLHASYYLRKRALEMQFNAKMSGKWIQVPEPNADSSQIQEWRPNVSYPKGVIVTLTDENKVEANKEFYMSVGSLGNRSQPDDFAAKMIYNIFNEPTKTFMVLQVVAMISIVPHGLYILFAKNNNIVYLTTHLLVCCALIKKLMVDLQLPLNY